MALDKVKIATTYPLPVYNYKVTVGSDVMAFSEVSGLTMEYEKVIYKDGFTYLNGMNIIRAQPKEITITMKRGIVSKQKELVDWITSKTKKDLTIDLCDPQGLALVRWKVRKAMPFKIDAPTFSATSNEVAIEQLQLVAQDLTIEYT